MKNIWKTAKNIMAYSVLFISSHALLLSYAPQEYSRITNLEERIAQLENINEQQSCEFENDTRILQEQNLDLHDKLSNLQHSYDKLQRRSIVRYAKYTDYIAPKFKLAHKYIDISLSRQIVQSLYSYTGPEVTVTSARRLHTPGSQHYCGDALDVRWNEQALSFINYLDSAEGKEWLDDNSLDYIIENVVEMKDHPKYMWNQKATGPHIHLHISHKQII